MKKYILPISLVIFLFTLSIPVFAVEGKNGETPTLREDTNILETKKSVRENLVIKLREQRCTRVTERVQNKVNGFDKNKAVHILRYRNIEKRANKVIADLKKLGYDTTKLENDMKTYSSLVQDFLTKYNLFVDSIKGAKIIACQENGEASGFKTQVQTSRGYLKDARDSAKAIHTFVKETLKKDFFEIRDEIKASKLNNNKDEK